MEQIGSPPESDELNEKMVSFLGSSTAKSKGKRGGVSTTRKRLGKSLKEMNSPE